MTRAFLGSRRAEASQSAECGACAPEQDGSLPAVAGAAVLVAEAHDQALIRERQRVAGPVATAAKGRLEGLCQLRLAREETGAASVCVADVCIHVIGAATASRLRGRRVSMAVPWITASALLSLAQRVDTQSGGARESFDFAVAGPRLSMSCGSVLAPGGAFFTAADHTISLAPLRRWLTQ